MVAIVPAPAVQFQPLAPPAVSVAQSPAHKVCDGEAVMVGTAITLMLIVLVEVHNPLFVPVTVYTVLAVGHKTARLPVATVVDGGAVQVYVLAPEALTKAQLPAQTAVGELTERVGVATTVTAMVLEATQPKLFVPVAVYTVDVPGHTVAE